MGWKLARGQRGAVQAQAGVCRLGLAVVSAGSPAQMRGHRQIDPEILTRREPAAPLLWRPDLEARGAALVQIALLGLRNAVPDGAFVQRAQKLDVLGVGPGERHAGAGWVSVEEITLGNVLGVPDLLGNQAALAGLARHGLKQFQRRVMVSGSEFVVRTFSREQGPATADAAFVERAPILLFA